MIWAVNSDFGTVVDDGSNRIEILARQSDQLENSSGHIEIVGTRYLDVKEAIFPSRNMRIPLNHFKRIEWPGFANEPGGKEIVVRCRQGIANEKRSFRRDLQPLFCVVTGDGAVVPAA